MATFTLTKNGTDYTSATLGITLLRHTTRPFLSYPSPRRQFIPGRHGYVDYGADLREMIFVLSCVFDSASSQSDLRDKAQTLAGILLDPATGRPAQLEISFSDITGLSWAVVYSNEISPRMFSPLLGEFQLEFSAYDPFGREPEDETEGTITTSPGTLSVTNSGNVPAPARYIIKNTGAATIHGFTLVRVKEV